jgi:hypothetical protein
MFDEGQMIRAKFVTLRPAMDERLDAFVGGARRPTRWGMSFAIVERATGLSRTTMRAGPR